MSSIRSLRRFSLILVSLLCLGAASVRAQPKSPRLDIFGEAKWPSHPMLLFAKYRGGREPVVAVEKNQPVIFTDGKRKTLSDSTPLTTQLAGGFSAAQVEFDGHIDITNRKWVQLASGGEATEWRDYTGFVSLKATTELPDCYVLISFFDGGSMDDPSTTDFFKTLLVEVGTLHRGESRAVPLAMGLMMPLHFSNGDPFKKPAYFGLSFVYWQVFSQGVEVRTQDLSDIEIRHTKDVYSKSGKTTTLQVTGVGTFVYLREGIDHEDAVEAWLKQNRKATQPARPYAKTPLQSWTTEPLPGDAAANLTVSKEGKVKEIAFQPAIPADAAKNLARCLKLWLYLPAVKNGSAVASSVRVPLGS